MSVDSRPVNPALAALAQRWATFMDKVRGRIKEIDGEAQAAYADVIASDAIDGTALSGVSSALTARFHALREKVEDSWRTIDAEIDKLDLDAREVGRFRGTQLIINGAFGREMERLAAAIIVKGEADAARACQAVAMQEVATTVPCQHCGAQLNRPLWHMAVNVTCPHCKAITTATPGTASVMFTGGIGAIALAREAAWPQWVAMQDAEHQFQRLRHPTTEDLARWEAVQRAYWQAYGEAMARVHPGWTPEHVANEVRGKMSFFAETTAKDDRTVRESRAVGLAAIYAGDANRLVGWLQQQRDPESAAEDMIWAALERGWTQHGGWVAQVAGPVVKPDERGWAAEKLDEVTYYYATSGR